MRAVHRLQFQPCDASAARVTLIDRYLGRDDHLRRGIWAAAAEWSGLGDIAMSLIDTIGMQGDLAPRDGAATIWHVLWARDERASRITIADHTWPIVPGDSVVAPPGSALRPEGRQLALAISMPTDRAPLAHPTHGEERYFGYNRQTICCRSGDIRLCRWKLTQPLALAEHHPRPALTLALARDSTIRTATEIQQLRQGELALIDPAANPTVTPDGLSYLLTVDRNPHVD